MKQSAFLHIVSHEGLPQAPFNEFEAELAPKGVSVQRTERPPSVFASLEALIPPAVMVILGVGINAYVRAFAEESAKSHVRLIESAVRHLARRILGPKGPEVTLIGTPGKLPSVPRYSHRFGLVADFGSAQLRLVFAPGEDPTEAIACFFRLVEQLHGPDAEQVTIAGDPGKAPHGLLVRYDPTIGALVFINPMAPPDSVGDTNRSSTDSHP